MAAGLRAGATAVGRARHRRPLSSFPPPIPSSQVELEQQERNRARTAPASAFAQWKKHTADALDRLGLPADYKGWTSRREYRGHGVPDSDRVHALLNAAWGKRLTTAKKTNQATDVLSLSKGFFCDLSQSISRGPYGRLSTLTTASVKYSFEGDCVLSGEDSLSTLGFPAAMRRNHGMTAAEIRSLAGEAFSLPCSATVLACFYLNPYGEWWSGS